MPGHSSSSRVSSRLAPDRMVGSDFCIVGKRIGAGNFGEVRLGKNVRTGEKVAVKIEISECPGKGGGGGGGGPGGAAASVRLRHEFDMIRRIYHGYPRGQKMNGIPRVHHFGRCGRADCMVLDLLGPNLEDLFEALGRRFSLKTVLMIAFQLLDRIEQVHKRGLVYRDVKPENFLLGRRDGRERNIIHLVDFGLAAFFRDPSSGRHLPYRDLKTMTGTARYMSVHSHLGKLQSRRDDLESIGYVLVYFARGSLPWQGLRTNNTREKYRKIRDSKMKCPARELCRGLPPQFAAYVSYVRKLAFSEEPDYEYLKDLFHNLYEESGFSYDDASFDWSGVELPSDLQRFNRAMGREGSGVSSADTEDDSHTMEDDEDEGKSKGGGGSKGGGTEGEKQHLRRRSAAASEEADRLGELKGMTLKVGGGGGKGGGKKGSRNLGGATGSYVAHGGGGGGGGGAANGSNGVLFSEEVSDQGYSLKLMDNASASTAGGGPVGAAGGGAGGGGGKCFSAKVGFDTRSASQGYGSASEAGSVKKGAIAGAANSSSAKATSSSSSSAMRRRRRVSTASSSASRSKAGGKEGEVAEEDEEEEEEDGEEQAGKKIAGCRCTEASFTEERVSFLCFSWRRKKRDVTTYHPHGRCETHTKDGDEDDKQQQGDGGGEEESAN